MSRKASTYGEEIRRAQKVLMWSTDKNKSLGRPARCFMDNISVGHRDVS